MRVHVLLPCYNEEENLAPLVEGISKECGSLYYQIVAVDDGSADETYQLLSALQDQYPMIVLRHDRNRGLQEALRTLLLWACANAGDEDLLVTMDSDLTHDPKYIRDLVEACRHHDLAIASRFVDGGKQIGVALHRRILSGGLRLLIGSMLGIPARDASSGYRCVRCSEIKELVERYGPEGFIEAQGFEVQLELLYKLFRNGSSIAEVPFVLDYTKKNGRSKLKLPGTVFRYIKTIFELRSKE